MMSVQKSTRMAVQANSGSTTPDAGCSDQRHNHCKQHPAINEQRSSAATLAVAFAQLAESSPLAANLLRVCAFLNADAIPEEIFQSGGEEWAFGLLLGANDSLQLITAIGEASQVSLLRRHPEYCTFSLPRLLQVALQSEMDEAERRRWAEAAVRLLDRAFPLVEYDNWSQCARLVPHAMEMAKAIDEYDLVFPEATRLLHQTGFYLLERGQHEAAEPILRRALQLDEIIFGSDHPRVAIALNNLATFLNDTNRLREAEPLLRRALLIDETSYGPDYPSLSIALNNLATLLQATNRLAEAESLLRRALQIDTNNFGSNHLRVAIDLNNLATLLLNTDRLAEVEALLSRAVDIFEESLGPDHPYTRIGVENYQTIRSELADEGLALSA